LTACNQNPKIEITESSVEPELQKAIDTWNQPLRENTLKEIFPVLADDYLHIDSKGKIETKKDVENGLGGFINVLEPNSHKINFYDLKVHRNGNFAYVTYSLTTSHVLKGSKDTTFGPKQIAVDIFEKRNGKWLGVYTQESKIDTTTQK
jgi:ketosteroid isomerase-like protein